MIIEDPENQTNDERELLEEKLEQYCIFGYPDIDEIEVHGAGSHRSLYRTQSQLEEEREKSFYIKEMSEGINLDPDPDEIEE
jgi:hypothetical protein